MGKGKHIGLGVAALAAGAGVAALAAGSHKNNGERAQKKAVEEKARAEYRNTERGRHEKNSKGIYYTNGNYLRRWTLQEAPATVSMIRPEDM